MLFYALGLGCVPWLSQSEIFTYPARGLGTGLATATNWAGNLLIGATFLTMMERMTPSGAFGFYAALCAVGWCGVVGWYPDLSGFSLEEVGEILEGGFGVGESRRRRRERERGLREEGGEGGRVEVVGDKV